MFSPFLRLACSFCFFWKTKKTGTPDFTSIPAFHWAGDERIELPPKVLETPIIPFDQSPVYKILWGFLPSYIIYIYLLFFKFFSFVPSKLHTDLFIQTTTLEKWSSRLRFASSRWVCSANFSYLTHQTAPSASWLAVCWFRTSIFLRFWSSPRPISGSPLHVLPHFHSCPIYLILFQGSYFL